MLLFAVFFFGKGWVGLVDGFRYVAYVCIWYVTYPLLIFEAMMMMMMIFVVDDYM